MPEVELNGTRLHYEIRGEGEPVAFLNGVLMTVRSWVLQSAFFRRRYACVLHDFRGQLLSAKPETPWTMDDHAADLLALLDHLEIERAHLAGTSYGAEVGMIFAAEHPERVASLTVIAATAEIEPDLDRAVAGWARMALTRPAELYRSTLPYSYSPAFIEASPDILLQGERRLAENPPEFFAAFARLVAAFRGLDLSSRLQRIRCPTLVLAACDDTLKPLACSRRIARGITNAEFLAVPDAGHAVVIEKPWEVNTALLGFLRKNSLDGGGEEVKR